MKQLPTPAARADKAIHLIKSHLELDRSFDDLFEEAGGDQVYRLVLKKAASDPYLVTAMQRRGLLSWINEAKLMKANQSELF